MPNEQVSLRADEVLDGLRHLTNVSSSVPDARAIIEASGPGLGATAAFYAQMVRTLQAAAAATYAVTKQVEAATTQARLAVEELEETNRVTAEQAAAYTAQLDAMIPTSKSPAAPPPDTQVAPKPASHSW